MANYRTTVEQLRYIADTGASTTFFSEEDLSAQRVQHQFLTELAKANRGNIFRELENAQQREPLIATRGGVVVNGNRRLAAMRELYASDSKRFERFGSVEIAVLPEWNEDQIIALETDLQMAEELKLEYGWVHTALALRNQLNDRMWSLDKASQHWKRDKKDLNALLSQLDLAEDYLAYVGRPSHYERVSNDQQAFQTLQTNLTRAREADPSEIEARKLAVFAVLSNYDAADVEGRVYDYASKAGPILSKLLSDPTILAASKDAEDPPTSTADVSNENPLAGLPGGQKEIVIPAHVLDVFRDSKNGELVARAADLARAELASEERQARVGNQLARALGEINSKASTLTLVDADPATIADAVSQAVAATVTLVNLLTAMRGAYPESMESARTTRLRSAAEALGVIALPEQH
jgi:hypothetical protein